MTKKIEIEDANDFIKEVLDYSYSVPVLLDLWAEWCVPCRTFSPILETVVKTLDQEGTPIRLVKANVDNLPDIVPILQVRGIPTLFLIERGVVVAEITGAMTAEDTRKWLIQGLMK